MSCAQAIAFIGLVFSCFFARPQPLWQVLSGGLAIDRVRACLYMHDVMQLSVSPFRFAVHMQLSVSLLRSAVHTLAF